MFLAILFLVSTTAALEFQEKMREDEAKVCENLLAKKNTNMKEFAFNVALLSHSLYLEPLRLSLI
jgi:hypothetical protein